MNNMQDLAIIKVWEYNKNFLEGHEIYINIDNITKFYIMPENSKYYICFMKDFIENGKEEKINDLISAGKLFKDDDPEDKNFDEIYLTLDQFSVMIESKDTNSKYESYYFSKLSIEEFIDRFTDVKLTFLE